jgi:hypothetical protein
MPRPEDEYEQLKSLLEEAARTFENQGGPRPEVLIEFAKSLTEYDALYRELGR